VYDTGHTFDTTKKDLKFSHENVFFRGDFAAWFRGSLNPINDNPLGVLPPDIDLLVYGRRAIAACAPTKPVASLATILGELREGIPRIVGSSFSTILDRASLAKSAGHEYLNLGFGWAPLIKDVTSLMDAVIKSEKIMAQLERDNGKQVRRKYFFPRMDTRTTVVDSNIDVSYTSGWPNNHPYNGFYNGGGSPTGRFTVEDVLVRDIYFKGAFTYYIDPSTFKKMKDGRYAELANKVLGSRMTPEVLWELAPWSWLADWFAELGTSITLLSQFAEDGLVLKYGYLMCRTRLQRIYTVAGVKFNHFNPGLIWARLFYERKQRIKSTPYGFGLNPNTFSDRQWAILVALGLSRDEKVIR